MFTATSTSSMLGVLNKLPKFDPLFLRMFFPHVHTSDTETIHFDEISSEVVMAPFVSPVLSGKVHKEKGGVLKSFKPAYVKPKHSIKPANNLKRRPGEHYLGDSTPAQRRNAAIVEKLADQDKAIAVREEWMAAQAVLYGKVTIEGEDFPKMEVDFGRSADNQITLTGAAKWDTVDPATYDPTDDLTTWAENATGAINTIIMGKSAWSKFFSFQAVKDKLDTRRGSSSELETATKDLGMVVSFKGYFGDVMILVYTGQFTKEDGSKEYFMPESTIIMGNSAYEGYRGYGAIQDVDATEQGVVAASRWPKNWKQPDPSVEYLMTQSAPLMMTPDADAFVVVQVA